MTAQLDDGPDSARSADAAWLLRQMYGEVTGTLRLLRDGERKSARYPEKLKVVTSWYAEGAELHVPLTVVKDGNPALSVVAVVAPDKGRLNAADVPPGLVLPDEGACVGLWLLDEAIDQLTHLDASTAVALHLGENACPVDAGELVALPDDPLWQFGRRLPRPMTSPPRLRLLTEDLESLPDMPRVPVRDLLALQPRDGDFQAELERARIRRRVAEQLARDDAEASWQAPPPPLSLSEALARDRPQLIWTVEGLMGRGDTASLIAAYKTGKTTLALNLVRSLVDDEPFLGERMTRLDADGTVCYLNLEVSEDRFLDWMVRAGIRDQDRVFYIALRGHRLDITTPKAAEWLVEQCRVRNTRFLIVDPFAEAFHGETENDNSQIARWFRALDQVKRLAEIPDALVVMHTGRDPGEQYRARGGTKLDDVVDQRWTYRRRGDDRVFAASGRDGHCPPRKVRFDPETLHLTFEGDALPESSAGSWVARNVACARAFLADNNGATATKIYDAMGGSKQEKVEALRQLLATRQVRRESGDGRRQHHHLVDEVEGDD